MRRRRWVIGGAALAAASVAALVVSLVVSLVVGRHSTPQRRAAAPAPVPAPVSTSAVATPPPPPPPPAIQDVAATAPTRFVMTGPAAHRFTIRARVCGMPNVRPLDPPGEQHHTVCWVERDFGVAPGSASATTYLLGHAWARDRLEVMNPASQPATDQIVAAARAGRSQRLDGIPVYPTTVLDGATITLGTATGTLVYTVRQVYGVAKNQAGLVRSLMDERTPRRIVLITCAEAHGVDYDYDVIVNAYLTRAVPTPR